MNSQLPRVQEIHEEHPVNHVHSKAEQTSATLLYGLVLALAVTLPFEVIHPVLSFRWFHLTNLELLVLATAVVWTIHSLIVTRRAGLREAGAGAWKVYQPFLIPALAFLLLATLSALTAPANQTDALKFVTRFAFGLYAFFLTIYIVKDSSRLHGVLWAIILGAGVSSLAGLSEAAGARAITSYLDLFGTAPTRVGGELRVSATFQYATIASMFFEMAVPLALAAAAAASNVRTRALATTIAVTCTATVVLTLTRAGILALAFVFILLLGLAWFRTRWHSFRLPTTIATLTLLGVIGLLAASTTAFETRLLTENDLNWYNASYSVPSALEVSQGGGAEVTVEVTNTGQATWKAEGKHAFALGYRWFSEDGQTALGLPHTEVPLPRDVRQGELLRVIVPLRVQVRAGNYRLAWGMLQRDILWFRHRGTLEPETAVRVKMAENSATMLPPPPLVALKDDRAPLPPSPSRTDLWPVALKMVAERPLLGIGPDNFRHVYGRYLDLPEWNDRIHANNLYLETLADLGLLGAASFTWLLLVVFLRLAALLRAPLPRPIAQPAVGLGAALIAFLVHGLLDYFLEFVSLYLLFWMTLGLIAAVGAQTPKRTVDPNSH